MIKKRSFILLSVWVVIIGCFNVACSGEKHTSQLSWGKYYLWNAPDSAFQILRTIPSPEKLSKEEYSLYALLMTQVMHSGATTAAAEAQGLDDRKYLLIR